MADRAPVHIPNRALFKAAEVCDLLKVQPYVLRSWETEFPDLGVAKTAGGSRVYRRSDVEQVLRIKHLLLVEGLTLAGARRRLEESSAPVLSEAPLDELIGQNARERLTAVKQGLRSLLDLLDAEAGEDREFVLAAPAEPPKAARRVAQNRPAARRPATRGSSPRNGASRRKRPA